MPSPFAITAATNTAMLDARREGAITFTVTNISGVALRGRTSLVTTDPKAAKWLSVAEEAERQFNIAQTEQYTVKIAVPPDAGPGSYPFHLDMVGTDNPDENFTAGPTVTFQVPLVEEKPKPFPWWALVVAAVVLIVLAGVGYYFYQDSQAKTAAAQTASALSTATQLAANATATQAAVNATATNAAANATGTAVAANATGTAVAGNATGTAIAVANATATARANATGTAIANATGTANAIAAAANRYSGNWTKDKSAAVGVAAMTISASGDMVTIHAWSDVRDILGGGGGAAQQLCQPTDCDWGTRTVRYTNDPLAVTFVVGPATYALSISLTSDADTLFLNQQTKIGTLTFSTAINFLRYKPILKDKLHVPPCLVQGTC